MTYNLLIFNHLFLCIFTLCFLFCSRYRDIKATYQQVCDIETLRSYRVDSRILICVPRKLSSATWNQYLLSYAIIYKREQPSFIVYKYIMKATETIKMTALLPVLYVMPSILPKYNFTRLCEYGS